MRLDFQNIKKKFIYNGLSGNNEGYVFARQQDTINVFSMIVQKIPPL